MTIYEPGPFLSSKDKRLLKLIAELLLYQANGKRTSNLESDKKPLSDAEAKKLLQLLETLFERKEFQENIYFAERMFDDFFSDEMGLREIFLSGRKRRGRTRVLASQQWSEFQVRLGKIKGDIWGSSVSPMEYEHFLKMEGKLFNNLGINPKVTSLMIDLISSQKGKIEKARSSNSNSSKGKIRKVFENVLNSLNNDPEALMSTNQLSAILTVVANSSVLYTTRDWTVAGTISAMAGAFISAQKE